MEKIIKNRRQLFAALRKTPENPDLLSQIAASYFDEKNYKKAYVYDRRAWMMNKKNAIHLSNLATDLGMLGWHEKAITLSKGIISWKLEKICRYSGVDMKRAKSIKNDCRFRISLTYYKLKEDNMARRYLNLYIKIKKRENLTTFISNDDQKGHWGDLNLDGKMKVWKEI
jgi:tetratricopeptide (TPR) repeat protein